MNVKSLIRDLAGCTSEEAVKASYIKHANFPAFIKDKVDLMVGSVLFEFKFDVANFDTNYYGVLAQAVVYYHRILTGELNLPIPTAITLLDKKQAVIVYINDVINNIANSDFDWVGPASSPSKKLVDALRNSTLNSVVFEVTSENAMLEYIQTIANINNNAPVGKRVISATNFEQVFEQWKQTFKDCFTGTKPDSLGSYFISDLLENTFFDSTKGVLYFPDIDNIKVEVPVKAYQSFWNNYGKPPAAEVQQVILSKAHMFMSDSSRRFTGAYFTPPAVSQLAYSYLDRALGLGWQDKYYVWDPCCGTGNLELPHKRLDRLFMSTLSMTDVLMIKNQNLFPGADIFQYDFLNGDYYDLPEKLRFIIENEPDKLIVLMNPPYAEATKSPISTSLRKTNVSFTKVGEKMLEAGLGAAKNELFMQFMYKVISDVPKATIAVFSTLKYIVAPNSVEFRDKMLKNKIPMMGFLVPGKVFPGVKGNFPVGFMIWGNGRHKDTPAVFNIYNTDLSEIIGSKVYQECSWYLNSWFKRPASGKKGVPLTGALEVRSDKVRVAGLSDSGVGYATMPGGDLQQSSVVFILSSAYHNGNGSAITPETFEFCMVSAAVRKLITPTWLNDRDQFTVPCCDRPVIKTPEDVAEIATTGKYATDTNDRQLQATKTNLPADFISDCVIWVLFNGCNNSSAFTAEYKDKTYAIQNEFYPFKLKEARSWFGSANDLHRSADIFGKETFVVDWLEKHIGFLSPEAKAVLDAGRELYKRFYKELPNLHKKKWKIETWNPGWYQIRMSMKEYLKDKEFVELSNLGHAMNILRNKLVPKVYELGFLPYESVQAENAVKKSDDDEPTIARIIEVD